MKSAAEPVLAAVEAGGTKFRCALVSSDLNVVESVSVPTTDPVSTLDAVVDFFARGRVAALGIACFGPVELDPASARYGALLDTPKPGWSGVMILRRLADALAVPVGMQTDVEAAAVAEQTLRHVAALGGCTSGDAGAAATAERALDVSAPRSGALAYVTVGTGIGAAVAVDGKPWRGRRHSELGHIPVRKVNGDDYPGRCPFHGDCLEGMACGPAIAERWGIDPSAAAGRADVWELEAAYLAQLVRVLAYSFAPDRVVFGGGVGTRPELLDAVRAASRADLGGYSDYSHHDTFITAPALGNDSGLLGAALIARSLLPG